MKQLKLVKRNNIYAGILYEPDTATMKVYNNGVELTKEDLEKLGIIDMKVSCGLIHRKIMFSMNENYVSNDLIYSSSNYAIEGFIPKEDVNKTIIIKDSVCLEPILKYLGFKEDLTLKDIKKIYKLLLKSDKFYYKNCELFGMKRLGSGEYGTTNNEHPLEHDLMSKLSSIANSPVKPSIYELRMKH